MGPPAHYLTIGYNTVEAIISVAAGLVSGSVGLVTFGVDSGIEVTSIVIMPALARASRRVAQALGSRALEADAAQTSLCAYLSLIALAECNCS